MSAHNKNKVSALVILNVMSMAKKLAAIYNNYVVDMYEIYVICGSSCEYSGCPTMLYVSVSCNYDSYYLVMDRRTELVIPWQGLITSDGSHHSMYILYFSC